VALAATTSTITLGTLAIPASATPLSSAHLTSMHRGARDSGAVFVQTDNLAGNAIVAYRRAADGSLTMAGSYATGGMGGMLTGSVVDHLASQGSLGYVAEHKLLIAVNAGSDTITTFSVWGTALNRRQVIGSGGMFPVSVAVHGDLVYVLNARGGGSIQGYRLVNGWLMPLAASHLSLGLNAAATPEFTNTPGQVAFSPDGSKLLITTKANGNQIDVVRLAHGVPSGGLVTNSDAGMVPFAITFNGRGRVVVGEAAGSVATFKLSSNGMLTLIGRTATNQAATCWIVADHGHVYAANAGSNSISAFTFTWSGVPTPAGMVSTDAGPVDLTVSPNGRSLYQQTGGGGDVDEFAVMRNGSLTMIGHVTVPNAVGGEGIVAT